ncbi:ABC transporter ATP-binding protein [Flexivirga oryzae]|uniref:Branched-chain amino acid transport system ATP-binding protein n=1 Tax=Flexivirga oryzae TaxID=1794944 RepID=A0A839NHD1_9MICO|nr:ABC transporter ATP-binding protein [Flexivirga oryzae]MBB2893832.1 branched-chain amino acid transport system ATP-binding protein [Flexivirga oryzae]
MSTDALVLDDVTLTYGSATAVFGLSLTVGAGEAVGILGRNGAGKTTTLRGILGSGVRRKGSIRYFGEEIGGMRADQVARKGIGWVPDDRRIYTTLTVRENLLLASRERSGPAKEAVDEAVAAVPLVEKLLPRKGVQLSGGEQQAVAIARAVVGRPKVLLLDEPAEGLAPIIVESLQQSVIELSRSGMTILIAEQNLNFVLGATQRVCVLDSGREVLTCSSEEFGNSPELQNQHLAISLENHGKRR